MIKWALRRAIDKVRAGLERSNTETHRFLIMGENL
jgi:hypothetical protein